MTDDTHKRISMREARALYGIPGGAIVVPPGVIIDGDLDRVEGGLPARPWSGAAPAAPVDEARERELFEAWATKHLHNLTRAGDGFAYHHASTAYLWCGWLARAQLVASETGPAEGVEQPAPGYRVIGYTSEHDLEFPFAYPKLGSEYPDRNIPVYVLAIPTAQSKPQEDA